MTELNSANVEAVENIAENKEMQTAKSGKMTLQEKSKVILGRMAVILAIDVVVTLFLLAMKNEAAIDIFFYSYFIRDNIGTYVFGAVAILAVAAIIFTSVKKIDISKWYITPAMVLGISIFGAFAAFFWVNLYPAYMVVLTAMLIVSVLYFVYNLFLRIFYK